MGCLFCFLALLYQSVVVYLPQSNGQGSVSDNPAPPPPVPPALIPETRRNRLINLGKAQKKGLPGILGLLKGLKLKVHMYTCCIYTSVHTESLLLFLRGFLSAGVIVVVGVPSLLALEAFIVVAARRGVLLQ